MSASAQNSPAGPSLGNRGRLLNAQWAVLLLVTYVSCQAFGAVLGLKVLRLLSDGNVVQGILLSLQSHEERKLTSLAFVLLFAVLFSGLVILVLALTFFWGRLRLRESSDAAWVRGSKRDLRNGFLAGLLLAPLGLTTAAFFQIFLKPEQFGPVTSLTLSPGAHQLFITILGIFIAPFVEELLFRGLIFGGLTYSFGFWWSAILTTAVFTVMHLSEIIHFWPNAITISLLGAALLALRVRTKSIGPCIVAHFAYNSSLLAYVSVVTNAGATLR